MPLDKIEYILFAIGVIIIFISMFLSYRLEKKRKESEESEDKISNKKLLKEITKLKKVYQQETAFDKIDDLYQLMEHKLKNVNKNYKEIKSQLGNFDEIKEQLENLRMESITNLDDIDNRLLDLQDKLTMTEKELEKKLDKLDNGSSEELEDIRDNLELILTSNLEFEEDISNLQGIIEDIKDMSEEEKEEDLSADENREVEVESEVEMVTEKKEDQDTETGETDQGKEDREEKMQDSPQKTGDTEENQTPETDDEEQKVVVELENSKYSTYKKIKEMKEAGLEISEIADRVNMGVREVELFWKVNSRG